jgi:hypothetical protein
LASDFSIIPRGCVKRATEISIDDAPHIHELGNKACA